MLVTHKVKTLPQISVNKLAEYLSTANPSRRNTILKDAKFATPFGADYRLAQLGLKELVGNPPYAEAGINDFIQELRKKYPAATPKQLELGRSALEAFRANFGNLGDLQDIQRLQAIHLPAFIEINGLKISMKPDIVFIKQHPRKGGQLGALKFWFTKSIPESQTMGEFVSTLMHHYLSTELKHLGVPISPDLCIAYDVHQGQRVPAPKSYVRRLQHIASGCQEIVRLWPTI